MSIDCLGMLPGDRSEYGVSWKHYVRCDVYVRYVLKNDTNGGTHPCYPRNIYPIVIFAQTTRTDILATNTNWLLESNAQKKHLAYDCMEFVQLLGSSGNKLTSEQI